MTKTLGHFQAMWDAYPLGEADAVKALIGGSVNAEWITNTCVVRLSRCLNAAGYPIPLGYRGLTTLKGGDGKRYAIRVLEFKNYLRATYGAPQLSHTYPGGEGGDVPPAFLGKQGIICFDVTGWSDASGHVDLWRNDACVNHGYFHRASKVHLWAVADGAGGASAGGGGAASGGGITPGKTIAASVGAGGANKPEDVKVVQTLLAENGVDPGPMDGACSDTLIEAIKSFQRRFASWPDGRVDPKGRTLRELNGI